MLKVLQNSWAVDGVLISLH